jgi:Zn-dependent oligopeptidase
MSPQDDFVPPSDALELRHRSEEHLHQASRLLDQVLSPPGAHTVENTLVPYNELWVHLVNGESEAWTWQLLHPDEALRDAGLEDSTRLLQRQKEVLRCPALVPVFEEMATQRLDAPARRLVELALRDLRLGGACLDAEARERLALLQARCAELEGEFFRNLGADKRSIRVRPEALGGLPAEYAAAHPPDSEGWVTIGTQKADSTPFIEASRDVESIRALQREIQNTGWPANEAVLREMLRLRHGIAGLLGFESWADCAAAERMAGSARRIEQFLDAAAPAARRGAEQYVAALLELKREEAPEATEVESWEVGRLQKLWRQRHLDLDLEQVREYLEVDGFVERMIWLSRELFGLTMVPVPEAPRWHEDVRALDVLSEGRKIGRLYLDLHPRPGKFRGGFCSSVRPGVRGLQVTQSVVALNLPRRPLDPEGVLQLVHEWGHALHQLWGGQVPWIRLSGTHGVTQDFVELPSMLMEEWHLVPANFSLLARHCRTAEPMPAELSSKLVASLQAGRTLRTSNRFRLAALSLRYHTQDPETLDLQAEEQMQSARHIPLRQAQDTHRYAALQVLASMSSNVYTYVWSLALVHDVLSEFRKRGLMDRPTAWRYVRCILEPGGSKEPDQLLEDFLGRPFSLEPFEHWLEGAGDPAAVMPPSSRAPGSLSRANAGPALPFGAA